MNNFYLVLKIIVLFFIGGMVGLWYNENVVWREDCACYEQDKEYLRKVADMVREAMVKDAGCDLIIPGEEKGEKE